jgi:hypothetical protein
MYRRRADDVAVLRDRLEWLGGAEAAARARRHRQIVGHHRVLGHHVAAGVDGLVAEVAREPEVDELHGAVRRDHDVVGLDVAVHDARGVRGGEATAGIDDHAHDLAPGVRLLHPLAEAHALDELHRDERVVDDVADVEHGDDGWMREQRERLRLAVQPRAVRLGELAGTHDLERDAAIELGIVGGVDDAHAAAAELVQHDVAAEHGRLRPDLFSGDARALACGTPRTVDQRRGGCVVRIVHQCSIYMERTSSDVSGSALFYV